MTIPTRVAAALLVLLALALRLPPALHPPQPQSDAADYQRLALGLREGRGYVDEAGHPTAFRPPLYPAFLALLGGSRRVAAPFQALLGTANVLLLVALGLRLLGNGPAPWIAGALLALDPAQAAAASCLLSETLYESLILLALLALPVAGIRGLALAGACCGLAALTRAAGLPLIVIVSAWLVWRHPWRWRAAGAFAAAAALTLSPWILRNALVLGAPVLTTQGGITLYSSYRPPEGRILGVLVDDDEVRRARAQGEVEADRQLATAALRLAASRPLETLRLALLKMAFFWVPIDWEVRQPPGLLDPVFLFALPFAAWGAWSERRRLGLASLVLAGFTLFSAAVYGSPRLRLPYEPLVHLLAAGPLAGAWRHPPAAVWAALCAGLGLAGGLARSWLRGAAAALGLW